ncbi:hypothetical protein [Streptomyces sp. NBC_00347]|uniref:hypothetical protein n=1 Tax=Streptomyces sp. NBC_00347 TaxID=2975721 RepID=UPI0022543BFD|nr:hypothetical protein [Streptomyces sp. NBC_00347]MCX5122331.1 hypothetical protein [Streptomyces sp. NBC_00347]
MSDRATFLIGRRRYESSFGAVGLDLDLLAGPRAFVPFAEAHAEATGSWYDDVCDPELAEPDPSVLVVTVGGRCHVLGMIGDQPVDEGPALLERLAGEPSHAGYSGACEGGVHVDPRLRRVGWWHTTRQPWLAEVGERWPGWTVEFWEDRWAEHVRRAPVLDVREPDRVAALAEVRDAALARWAGARLDVRAAVRAAAPRALVGRGLAPPLAATRAAEAREAIIRAHASAL